MFCLKDFERHAEKILEPRTWAFYSQGAEREETLRENMQSFTRYKLLPQMLCNAPQRDLTTTVLGEKITMPVGIAPSAYQKLAHPDGEIAAAKAAADMGIIYTLSTVATTSLEDVAKSVPKGSNIWFQIYTLKDKSITKETIRRAEAHGYKALVLTVDTPVTGLQLRLWRDTFKLPPHLSTPNIAKAIEATPGAKSRHLSNVNLFCETLSWDDVTWIKRISSLPLILKGILTVEDALKAVKYGASGVWVSNHGGRQLDCVDAAIDALPAISAALQGSGCEIYVDGGVRWGSDVFKAIALGAKAVFLGRPALWGLAYNGQDGVRNVLDILKKELDRTMHLMGCKDIADIGPHLLKKVNHSSL